MGCSKKQPRKVGILVKDPDYIKAKSLFSKNKDSAFYYFNKVATSSRDSLSTAFAYNYMAWIQNYAGDNFGSQESLLASLKFLDERNPKHLSCLSSNYNELGSTSFNLKNYDAAIFYYDSARRYTNDKEDLITNANNIGLVYQEKRNYNRAIKIFSGILLQSKETPKIYARILTNLSYTKWLQNPAYNPEPELRKALSIREAENDEWGLNSSYAHLADYYTSRNISAALFYAKKMHHIAVKLDSPDDQLEALQKLIQLSPQTDTRRYFTIYHKLSDSLQTARNTAKNQFALIRYEAQKSKSENLQLQKENTIKRYQIFARELLILGIALFSICAFVFAVIWFKRRKRLMEISARNALRDSQLKTSKKVHDVVANGLYRVMTEIGNRPGIDKEEVLDRIETLYEKSRDISYENPNNLKNFNEVISELLISFATEDTKILIAGNNSALWKNVSDTIKYELEHILQELLVNMKKHSQATNVALKFEHDKDRINIYYTDNGVGMPNGVQENNGIRNTGNRIATVGGAIIFDTKVEKGLKIQITFPNP